MKDTVENLRELSLGYEEWLEVRYAHYIKGHIGYDSYVNGGELYFSPQMVYSRDYWDQVQGNNLVGEFTRVNLLKILSDLVTVRETHHDAKLTDYTYGKDYEVMVTIKGTGANSTSSYVDSNGLKTKKLVSKDVWESGWATMDTLLVPYKDKLLNTIIQDAEIIRLPQKPLPCIISPEIPETIRPGFNVIIYPGSQMFNKLIYRQEVIVIQDHHIHTKTRVRVLKTCYLNEITSVEINAGFSVRSKEELLNRLLECEDFVKYDCPVTMVGLDL